MNCDLAVVAHVFREGNYTLTSHAYEKMQTRGVSTELIEEAVGRDSPKIIESYTEGCLILGWGTPSEPLHAVIIFKVADDIRLITVYRPDESPEKWSSNYEQRCRN